MVSLSSPGPVDDDFVLLDDDEFSVAVAPPAPPAAGINDPLVKEPPTEDPTIVPNPTLDASRIIFENDDSVPPPRPSAVSPDKEDRTLVPNPAPDASSDSATSENAAIPSHPDRREERSQSPAESSYCDTAHYHPPMSPVRFRLASLQKRHITIVLVGETGVGKTSFMSLLANYCAGRGPADGFDLAHDPTNESNLPLNQSQTNSALLYKIPGPDGLIIRILDTPGLADTRGLEQDELHKAGIVASIRNQVNAIDAVIVMANGTVERLGIATDYALETIAAMFPRSIAENIGFLFTNVADILSFNFQTDSLPEAVRDAEIWTMQNPVAQYVRYTRSIIGKKPAKQLSHMRKLIETSYENTMEMLDGFFEWIDARAVQPTTEILAVYEMTVSIESSILDVISRMNQQEQKRRDLETLMSQLKTSKQSMKINEKFEKIMQRPMMVQKNTTDHNTLCAVNGCHANCHISCSLEFLLNPDEIGRRCIAFQSTSLSIRLPDSLRRKCITCGHSAKHHRHYHTKWAEEIQTEKVVDLEAKGEYESARERADSIQKKANDIEVAIAAINDGLAEEERSLNYFCANFQNLALSGSFSGHIASAMYILKLRYETMKKKGADPTSMEAMEERIAKLKVKYEVVVRASRTQESKAAMYLTKIKGLFSSSS